MYLFNKNSLSNEKDICTVLYNINFRSFETKVGLYVNQSTLPDQQPQDIEPMLF